MEKKRKGIGWIVLVILLTVILVTVLELGKHTILGWILAVAAILVFAVLYARVLREKSRLVRLGSWCCLLGVLALILWVSWPPAERAPAVEGKTGGVTEVLHVKQGDLTGVKTEDGAVEVFAGIPYAKPPVGELRWKAPVPADPWEGVLAADHFAPMSMQTTDLPIYGSLKQIVGYHDYQVSLEDNWRGATSEDSLYLNIWRPAGGGKDLPVLVYIHGGSLQTGHPWYQDYSGEGLARDGVIVVNMGYRLGIFGFFADEELRAESPEGSTGNYGLMDQILALKWVQENISAFGGDPGNVTLSGESAGSACVTALCTSPLARGLFRRVMAESSTVTAPEPAHSFRTMEEALKAGEETKKRFGVSTIAEMRALSAEKIVAELNTHHHMTVDGYVLPVTPYEAYAQGVHNEEAQMHGFNREEAAPFILFSQASLGNYESKIRGYFGDQYTPGVLGLYPAVTDEEARNNWADISTAVLFTYGHYCLERQALANGIPTYVYHFVKKNGRLGSWHSGEEVYFYGNIPADSRLYDEKDRALADVMKAYFLNFIRSGDPNGEGLPLWPASEGKNLVLEMGEEVAVKEAPYLELYRIMDEMTGF